MTLEMVSQVVHYCTSVQVEISSNKFMRCMSFYADICGSQMMNPNDFGDFRMFPSVSQ